MAGSLLNRLSRAFQTFEQTLDIIFGRGFPPAALCAVECNHGMHLPQPTSNAGKFSLKDILSNGILWAVPKHRRSLEKRHMRRFGVPKYHWKPHVPKTNILMCVNCGHYYEDRTLCGHCYERVKQETQEMQDAIQANLGLSPVEQEVVVLYEGESENKSDKFWKNQRVVELPKKRPQWFNQNLLESTTEESSDKTDVKLTNLA